MQLHLDDGKVPIVFQGKFREYGIRFGDYGKIIQRILFCPWCGTLLPASKRPEWLERIERLGLAVDSDEIPAEMRSEEWWAVKS